jgi:hypothetical protein
MKMVLPRQLVVQINNLIGELELVSVDNKVTSVTEQFINEICDKLDELAN